MKKATANAVAFLRTYYKLRFVYINLIIYHLIAKNHIEYCRKKKKG